MQSSSVPAKFGIPFANAAGSSYVRTIPQASQIGVTAGAASLTDGFPPACFSPVAAGGTPPWGADMNGILKQITQWNQWQQAGAPIIYDSSFQTAIGGYPAGAIVQLSAGGPSFFSTSENNTVTPAVGAVGWMPFPTFGANVTNVTATATLTAANAGLVIVNATSGNITLTLPSVSSESGIPLPFEFVRVDSSGNSVTLAAASGNTFVPGGASTYSIAAGIAVQFSGNGVSTWNLIASTAFAAINGSASQAFNVANATTSTQAMPLGQLPSQFPSTLTTNGYKKYPDASSPTGYSIEQWGTATYPTQITTTSNFPIAFPNACINFVCSLGSSIPTTSFTSVGGQSISNSQFQVTVASGSTGSDAVFWRAIGY